VLHRWCEARNRAAVAEKARREVLAWAQNRSGGRLPSEAWEFQDFEYFSGGRNSAVARINGSESDIWAIRADDPDKDVAGRIWTTEVVIGFAADTPCNFSARLLASSTEEELKIIPHTPGFVQQVSERCTLSRGPIDLSHEPWLIDTEEEGERLIETLTDQSRAIPVFILSVAEDAKKDLEPLLDAQSLARATLGTALVAVVPAAYTWLLTERFGKLRSVFGGAVRTYLPGFSEDASPYSHRLVLAQSIQNPGGAAECTRWMRSLAAAESLRRTRLGKDVLPFTAIRSAALQLRQQELDREGASDSQNSKLPKPEFTR
jgi:hypothetical protein